jgi:glycosyltransferase involved in cell wall biosynthesis/SAM-dependent methyltransferase
MTPAAGPVERLTPGEQHPYYLVQEHINRYLFASKYVDGKIVADLGCGAAYGSLILAKRGAKRIIAIDSSPSALRLSRRDLSHPSIEYVLADVTCLPLRKNSVDVIVSFEIMEHLTRPIELMTDCQRALRGSGTLIVSTPNKEVFSPTSSKPDNPHHVHEFFIPELELLLGSFYRSVALHGQTSKDLISEEADANLCSMPRETNGYSPEPDYEVHRSLSTSDRMIVAVCRLPKNKIPVLSDVEKELALIHFRELSIALETRLKIESQKPSPDPMFALLRLYWLRKDLQNSFPEVASGEYTGLLNWAKATASHKKDDSHRRLASFAYWYKTNPLSELTSTRDSLTRSEEERKTLGDRVNSLLSELTSTRDSLTRSEEERKTLGDRVNSLLSELTSTRDSLTRSEEERKTLGWELDSLKQERTALGARLEALLQSWSWRLSAPLRWVGSLRFTSTKRKLPTETARTEKAIASTSSDGLVACTIAAKNYLSHVRILTDSFLKYHPTSTVFVLLVDEIDGYFDPDVERFRLIRFEELGIERPHAFRFKYNVLELCTAVKPFLLEHLFKKFGLRKVVYLDPDVLVTDTLHDLSNLLDSHDIILTPHILEPVDDDRRPSELDILLAGTYNLGFIAISSTGDALSFLRWWQRRVYDYCTMDPLRGLHVDQKWVELALGFFHSIHILRDPGYNVAYWNMGTRRLTVSGGRYFTDNRPLRFFHFSGLDPDDVNGISRHQNRVTLGNQPEYRPLFETYRNLLDSNGYQTVRRWPYTYDYFDNEVRIPEPARRMYRESTELQKKYPDPFATRTREAYLEWLNGSAELMPRGPYITRLWYEIYKLRKDVRETYPDVFGSDRAGFIAWVINTGWKELRIDETFLPSEYFSFCKSAGPKISRRALREPATIMKRSLQVIKHEGVTSFLRHVVVKIRRREFRVIQTALDIGSENAGASPQTEAYKGVHFRSWTPTSQTHKLDFGVNLAGYFTGRFGVAESSRAFAKALELAHIPHVLNKIVAEIHGERQGSSNVFTNTNPYAINLIHVNADMAESFFNSNGPAYSRDRYNIGIWYWETSKFPARWLPAFEFYDEIWVTSSFIAECLSRIAPVPVVKMRYPLLVDTSRIDRGFRNKIREQEDALVFLFLFDFLSIFERKNPLGVLKAFAQAFQRNDNAALVLNCINKKADPLSMQMLRKASRNLNVRIIAEHLSDVDYLSLLAACDCYVSLHRSEGLGVPMAQAMYLGKPVIATAYGGNVDFMNTNNSLPVKYELVELDRDHGPYEKGSVWADPDIGHASELMRWVYQNRGSAKGIGERAAKDIREFMDPATASEEVRVRLQHIYSRRFTN